MQKKLWYIGILILGMISCQKQHQKKNNPISGIWVSVSYVNEEGSWVKDVMPHYWTFTEETDSKYFKFREHNGVECQGEFNLTTPINSNTQIDFLKQNCGLSSREIFSYAQDTMVLRVINSPNVTKDKVKYVKIH